MNWILITIIGLVLLVILVKAKEIRHHLVYRTLAVVGILLVLSVAYVWMKSEENLTTYEGFLSFGRTYYSWLGSLFGNARGVTGYAVQQSWGLNSTVIP